MTRRRQAALKSKRYLRGSSEQCPKCGCRKVRFHATLEVDGYGPGVAVCPNCKALWEAFDPAQIWDTDDAVCSFREPCNNCAFRPRSEEQSDRQNWRELLGKLKNGAQFYCHKGVPIEPGAEHGFAYPKDTRKLRICRGYLNAIVAVKWRPKKACG